MKQLEEGGVRYLIGNASWSAFWFSLLSDATYTTNLPLFNWDAVLPELEKEMFFLFKTFSAFQAKQFM